MAAKWEGVRRAREKYGDPTLQHQCCDGGGAGRSYIGSFDACVQTTCATNYPGERISIDSELTYIRGFGGLDA
jgi:hypothetical protein